MFLLHAQQDSGNQSCFMHRYCSVHETRLLTRILLCMQHKLFLQRKNPPNKRATPANAPRVDQTRAPPHQNTPPVHTKSLCSPDLALYLGQKCKDCNDKKTSAKVVNFPPPGVFFVLVKRDPTPILIVREAYHPQIQVSHVKLQGLAYSTCRNTIS